MAERFTVGNGLTDLLTGLGLNGTVASFVSWLLAALVLVGALLGAGGILSFVMRKIMARIGTRLGPNRVGPFGLLQFLADGLKMISKEAVTPARADPWLYNLAPYFVILPIILAFAPLPFSNGVMVADIRIGFLFVLAISAVSPIGELLAGWASNNKYSMLGSLRAAALDISYEIPLVMAAISTVLLVSAMGMNGLSFVDIVNAQQATLWFLLLQPIGLFIFFVSALAKAGIVPTDLPEAESELVAGYMTEYGGMKFGVMFVGVFVNIVLIAALTVLLFFGGWTLPFLSALFETGGALAAWAWVGTIIGLLVFVTKVAFFVAAVFIIWFTLPRFRPDQFLTIGWKVLFPLALVNLVITLIEIRYILPVLGGA